MSATSRQAASTGTAFAAAASSAGEHAGSQEARRELGAARDHHRARVELASESSVMRNSAPRTSTARTAAWVSRTAPARPARSARPSTSPRQPPSR